MRVEREVIEAAPKRKFTPEQVKRYKAMTLKLHNDGVYTLKIRLGTKTYIENISSDKSEDELVRYISNMCSTARVGVSDTIVKKFIDDCRANRGRQRNLFDLVR